MTLLPLQTIAGTIHRKIMDARSIKFVMLGPETAQIK